MAQVENNFGPISMAVLLHLAVFSSMLVAFNFASPAPPPTLIVKATLVEGVPEFAPPVVEDQPEPEPVVEEPEPVVEEPEPEPDNSEELRRQAEEEKRVQDALIEKERLEKIRQQKETEEAERKRKEREEAERKKKDEERKERERQEAERKRQEDIKRQREENERLRRELEAEQRQEEIDAETNRLAAVDAGALAVYMTLIRQKVERNLSLPASAGADFKCSVRVSQIPGGEVIGVTILTCNGDDAVQRAVEAAIYRSSPLPEPSDPSLFDRKILLNLSKRQ